MSQPPKENLQRRKPSSAADIALAKLRELKQAPNEKRTGMTARESRLVKTAAEIAMERPNDD
ncbi:MAG TPA: replication protein RepA, partial [Xylella sp.]